MDKNGNPVLPQKFSSFSSSAREEKLRESDRNLSLGNIKLETHEKKELDLAKTQIKEDEEGENADEERKDEDASHGEEANPPAENEPDFATLSEEVDQFLASLANTEKSDEVPEIPESVIEKFLNVVEKTLKKYDNEDEKWLPEHDDLPLLPAIGRVMRLTTETEKYYADPKYAHAMNHAGGILHLSMAFLEEEFYLLLLEDPHVDSHRTSSFGRNHESDRCVLPPSSAAEGEGESKEPSLPYPSETIEWLREIATTMISAGYITECCQIFSIARRNAFESSLSLLGFERPSIDDLVRMAWEPLEGEIATWIKAFKHALMKGFPCERDLANKVFNDNKKISAEFFSNLVSEAILHLLNFPEAMFMTKCSAEKLFKMLDIYEALKDSEIAIESFFPEGDVKDGEEDPTASYKLDLKSEVAAVRSHIGELAKAIFCELERSIKADTTKNPVPGGAVHPLTRYVMNYLKYVCAYKNTLEEIFREHHKTSCDNDEKPEKGNDNNNHNNNNDDDDNPFAAQLVEVMDLLNSNLDTKSKLYKDISLSHIFLMNNGRYIVQKIKGSEEASALLGETWIRNRSADVRNYHKSYQRETWSKLLACLKNDGLVVKGNVQKPVLKERFKSFNAMFEEIHRTQSAWVVSDEQLKSELRVSIQAVVVQAYRSFKGRFEQNFRDLRQTEKYIKFSVEDLERYVDELFEGNPTSMVRRR
ncbi:exocyst complex component EXO70C1-like [Carex rostrata]